ncbi:MAG: hypothetical protein IJ056_01630 [Acidaminococcaceae bacterium]|nr:hypothetical protein [Acidaminococcaceae bacterium]MBQ9634589.1 hypothetical protein [Acidaminococcaceae bacterium]MBQ9634647.1 hypothetical protein [Acidaminococcaceae bacterium]
MILDKTVELEIEGKTYKLCYPMKSVHGAERELFQNNLLVTVAQGINGLPPNLSDMYTIFKWGIKGGNPDFKEGDIENLYYAAVREYDVITVFRMGLDAVKKSGILGDTTKKPAAVLATPGKDPDTATETPRS